MELGSQRVYARPGYFVPHDPDSSAPCDVTRAQLSNSPQAGLTYRQWLVGQLAGPVMAEIIRQNGDTSAMVRAAMLVGQMADLLCLTPAQQLRYLEDVNNGTV